MSACLTALCRHAVWLTGTDCAVLVYTENPAAGGDAFGVAASDERGPALAGPNPYAPDEPWAGCLHSAEPCTAADLSAQAGAWPRFAETALGAGLTALTLIPVAVQGIGSGGLALLGGRLVDDNGMLLARVVAGAAGACLTVGAELRRQRTTVTQLQGALSSRIVIEQAKGMLAERWQVSPDEAFAALRRRARADQKSLPEVAMGVITGALTLPPGP